MTPVRTLVVPRAGELEIRETEEPDLPDGRFRAQTLFTGLSAGTELTWYRGTSPYFTAGWDAELGVFDASDGPRTMVGSFRAPARTLGAQWADNDHLYVYGTTTDDPASGGTWIRRCDLDGRSGEELAGQTGVGRAHRRHANRRVRRSPPSSAAPRRDARARLRAAPRRAPVPCHPARPSTRATPRRTGPTGHRVSGAR